MKLDAARLQWLMVEEKWLTAKLERMLYQGTALTEVLFACFGKHFRHFKWTVWGMGKKHKILWIQKSGSSWKNCTHALAFWYQYTCAWVGPNICSNPKRLGPGDLLWPPLGSRDNTLWWGPGGKSPEADKSFKTTTLTHKHTGQKSPSGCTVIEFYAVFLFCLDPQIPISLNKVKISLLFLSLHTHWHNERCVEFLLLLSFT